MRYEVIVIGAGMVGTSNCVAFAKKQFKRIVIR